RRSRMRSPSESFRGVERLISRCGSVGGTALVDCEDEESATAAKERENSWLPVLLAASCASTTPLVAPIVPGPIVAVPEEIAPTTVMSPPHSHPTARRGRRDDRKPTLRQGDEISALR